MGRSHEDHKFYRPQTKYRFKLIDLIKLGGALVGILIGGLLTVITVENLSNQLNLSTSILGLSLTAVATSLPELLTTVFSQKQHQAKITIGNLIGSNIYNLSLIGGIILFFSNWQTISFYEIIMLILATMVFVLIIIWRRGQTVPKKIGYLLFLLFGCYIYGLTF